MGGIVQFRCLASTFEIPTSYCRDKHWGSKHQTGIELTNVVTMVFRHSHLSQNLVLKRIICCFATTCYQHALTFTGLYANVDGMEIASTLDFMPNPCLAGLQRMAVSINWGVLFVGLLRIRGSKSRPLIFGNFHICCNTVSLDDHARDCPLPNRGVDLRWCAASLQLAWVYILGGITDMPHLCRHLLYIF